VTSTFQHYKNDADYMFEARKLYFFAKANQWLDQPFSYIWLSEWSLTALNQV
jgi:hypothetical protein